MIKTYFYDTDCISSFLWVNREDIIITLYSGRMVLPREVYDELSHPSVPHLKDKIDTMVAKGHITIEDITLGSEKFELFTKMTSITTNRKQKIIGDGEASALAHAIVERGVVASNNLSDVKFYIDEYNLELITTGEILYQAYESNYITMSEGNNIWTNMLKRRRQLPTRTFEAYIVKFINNT